jgi:hypothetical protein
MNCKNCFKEHNNGTKFCSHKCRVKWRLEHEIKGAKKKYRDYISGISHLGSDFANDNDCQNRY